MRPYLHKAEANPTPHLARPNLQVFTGAHASRILTQGRRAVGVECMQDGLLKQLRTAGEVRLCAGALQSPQRRMLSGMGDHAQLLANGIATAYHLPGVGLHLHDPVGSCRMGPGGTGEHLDVVDARLRVHGMAGLRVVDASVMPRIVSASTTVATTMLAEKAADMLTEDAAQR